MHGDGSAAAAARGSRGSFCAAPAPLPAPDPAFACRRAGGAGRQARVAMETLSDSVLDGRPIFVREDRH